MSETNGSRKRKSSTAAEKLRIIPFAGCRDGSQERAPGSGLDCGEAKSLAAMRTFGFLC
jgi:hypothetical protein